MRAPFAPKPEHVLRIGYEAGTMIAIDLDKHSGKWPEWPGVNGGEGGIRTHVPELPDHPISSRRRCDRFGTSPVRG
jgi:hypothetical protein